MPKKRRIWAGLLVALLLAPCAAGAEEATQTPSGSGSGGGDSGDGLWQRLREETELTARARYRLEHVDQDGFEDNALASTLGLKVAIETPEFRGLSVLVEGAGTAIIGSRRFNSTENGRTRFPVVADPAHVELNRAQLTLDLHPRVNAVIGRQTIELGNERFVGNDSFRQDDQTFDAVRVSGNAFDRALKVTGIVGNRVNRIFGNGNPAPNPNPSSFNGRFVLTEAEGKLNRQITVQGYGHWFKLDEAPLQSTRTIGARLEGVHDVAKGIVLGWTGEYAYQTEAGNNPANIDLFYAHGEARAKFLLGEVTGGVEVLDGNGTVGFSTPLATLHKFNGRADAFLVTPADGLRDIYLGLESDLPGLGPIRAWQARVRVHDFASADGAVDLGQEIDAALRVRLSKRLDASAEYARYVDGSAGSPPTQSRIWLAFDVSL